MRLQVIIRGRVSFEFPVFSFERNSVMNSHSWHDRMHADLIVAGMAETTQEACGHPRKSVINRLEKYTIDAPAHYMRWGHANGWDHFQTIPDNKKLRRGNLQHRIERTCGCHFRWVRISLRVSGRRGCAFDPRIRGFVFPLHPPCSTASTI